MNHVDKFVKENIQRNFRIFQHRFDVFHHVFLSTGNGYEIIGDNIVLQDAKPMPIDFDFIKEYSINTEQESDPQTKLLNEIYNHIVIFYAENIDTLSTKIIDEKASAIDNNSFIPQPTLTVEKTYSISSEETLLYKITRSKELVAQLSPEWIEALEELMKDISILIPRLYEKDLNPDVVSSLRAKGAEIDKSIKLLKAKKLKVGKT